MRELSPWDFVPQISGSWEIKCLSAIFYLLLEYEGIESDSTPWPEHWYIQVVNIWFCGTKVFENI